MKSPQGWLPLYTGLTVDNNGRDVDEQQRFPVRDVEKNAKSKPRLSKENTSLTSVVNQTNSHFFSIFSSELSWKIFVMCVFFYWLAWRVGITYILKNQLTGTLTIVRQWKLQEIWISATVSQCGHLPSTVSRDMQIR